MEFNIRNIGSGYTEIKIKLNGCIIESGTLNQKELTQKGLEFLGALDDITCYIKGDHAVIDQKMVDIREYLERI